VSALDAAIELATRPGFDCLFDPNPTTPIIEPYWDPSGYPTRGYGRLLSRIPWEPLDKYPPVTKEAALEDVRVDMRKALASVGRLIAVALTDNQRAALADFAFNAGAGELQASTLRRQLNRGEFDDVPNQLMRFVYSNHVKYAGLVRRRHAEAQLFQS
jgi:lysozyme